MREGKKTIRLEDIVADRDRIDAQRAERQAAKAANANEDVAPSSSTDDRLPNNTPVWLHWPPTVKRALLTHYTRGGNPVCRVGAVDTKGAYTGRLGSERTFEPSDVLGPIWLIDSFDVARTLERHSKTPSTRRSSRRKSSTVSCARRSLARRTRSRI